MTIKEKRKSVDPITLSVMWNRLLTITREAGERVVHSAQSYVMANARDLGPVLLNDKAQIVTSVEFLPCHCLLAEIPTKAILGKFGKLDPGDMVLGNDGFIVKSGHLPDWTWLVPIYWHDELVFYMHFRAHVMDTGGAFSGSYFPRAYDCIAEGLNIPPVKIIKKGKINEEVREVIFDNIRTPGGVWSDLMLIYGSIMRAEKDICELVDKYGLDTVNACCDEMIRRDEEATRAEIRQFPEGVYYGAQAVDWDGSTPNRPVWIRVKLTVKGDEMTFDFSESDNQVDFVNSPLGNTHAYVYLAFFLAIDPSIPHNHGARVPVNIIAPEGKVVNPTRPHTFGACACSCGCEIYEACTQALGKASPDKTQAPSSKHSGCAVSGRLPIIDPRTGSDLEFFGAPFMEESGIGAPKGYDGWDGMVGCPLYGVIYRGSVEMCEFYFPFIWPVLKFEQNYEGAGEFIGARGTFAVRENIAPPGARVIFMTGDTAGEYFSPQGVAGAPPAPLSEMRLRRAGKSDWEVVHTIDMVEAYPGDILTTKAGGGAGWGDPLTRDVEKVKNDVRDELISVQRARDVYGVVIKPESLGKDPWNIEVDYRATEQKRKNLKVSKEKQR